ncbi:hypothetical protein OAO01_09705, partial [Oligoflexia bacterium]|nr:hypothetical protein [Oligoflexia bacterium]
GSGRRVICCGAYDYQETREAFERAGLIISEGGYLEVICRIRGADKAILLGERDDTRALKKQPFPLLHLDQCMLGIEDGRVVIAQASIPEEFPSNSHFRELWDNALRTLSSKWLKEVRSIETHPLSQSIAGKLPVEPEKNLAEFKHDSTRVETSYWEERNELENLRIELLAKTEIRYARDYLNHLTRQMEGLGFQVDRLETPARNILAYVSYLNALLYMDKNSGEKVIHIPVYPNDQPENVAHRKDYLPLNPTYFTDSDRKAIEYFRMQGFKVYPTRQASNEDMGNNHCMYR